MAWSKDYGKAAKAAADKALAEAQRAEEGADRVDAAVAEVEAVTAENKTRFLNAVSTVALRNSTYPNPLHGDTVRVTSEAKTYRFVTGSGWVVTDEYNATAIDNVAAQLAEKDKFDAQADYVKLIEERTSYKRLRVKKITSPFTAFSVVLDDGVNHVTHEWKKNALDDLYIYLEAFAGALKQSDYQFEDADERTGTFVTSSPPNIYTQQLNATITGYVKGSQINFNSFADNRGGVWEFVIDGNVATKKTVSVYNATGVIKTFVLATGLDPNVLHTIVGTFKGDDPVNVPSGGAGTSRGWFRYEPASATYTNHTFNSYRLDNGTYANNTMLLGQASNKEFAFNITVAGENQWFPEHNNVGTAFQATPPKFIIDSVELDFANMVVNEYVEGNFVEIIQEVYCKFPTVTGNIAKLKLVYTINKEGVVALSGNLEILQNCLIVNGYTMMFPLVGASLKELVTGIGSYKSNSADDSIFYFTAEKDKVYSVAGIDSRNPDLIAAMTIDYPLKTLRIGKAGRDSDISKSFYLWQRATYPKYYPVVFKNYNAVAGEKYSFHGRYAVGKLKDAYSIIKE